jgi:uncharacterized protein YndB with AHSA1/START domain
MTETRVSVRVNAPPVNGYLALFDRIVSLAPNEQVVEVVVFETKDPAPRGEMTITFTLTEADGGTDILAVHDGLPPGLSSADNETGWRMSLAKLAALVEGRHKTRLDS